MAFLDLNGLSHFLDKIKGVFVTGPSSVTANRVATFDGTTGKLIKDSGYTIAKSVPSDAKFTDTTYSSKTAASGGTDVSLVTTGEKYTWNSKTSNTGTVTSVATGAGLTGGTITTSGTISINGMNTSSGSTAKCLTEKGTWASFTNNAGTVTGIKMNGASKGTSGVVDLGTVITSENTYVFDYGVGASSFASVKSAVEAGKAVFAISSNTIYRMNGVQSSSSGITGVYFSTYYGNSGTLYMQDMLLTSSGWTTASTDSVSKSTSLSLTLASGSWSSSNVQTLTDGVTGVTESNNIIITLASNATSTQYDAYVSGKILCTTQATNSLTFKAYGTKPTTNIPISVLILG